MRTLFGYIRPKAGIIALEMCIKFTGTIIELLLPWMLSVILDDYVPMRDLHGIFLWGGLMVISAALAFI